MSNKKNIKQILQKLHTIYKNPKTELKNWRNPMQFVVCVILSAQATDKGVNKITSSLFNKYKSVKDFATADLDKLTELVSSINYYKTKAIRIKNAARHIKDHFDSKIPRDINKLITIPGIGRKSANVILNEAFETSQGIVVDTHATRVSNRLGLTNHDNQKDAEKIEAQLKRIIPLNEWRFYSSAIVLHGRYICKSKKPDCKGCVLNKICPSAFEI